MPAHNTATAADRATHTHADTPTATLPNTPLLSLAATRHRISAPHSYCRQTPSFTKPHKEAHQQPHRTRRNQKNEPQEHIRHSSPIAIRPADSNPSRAYRIAQHNTRSAPFLRSAPPQTTSRRVRAKTARDTHDSGAGRTPRPHRPSVAHALHTLTHLHASRAHTARARHHTLTKAPDLTQTHTNSTHTHTQLPFLRHSTQSHTAPKENEGCAKVR